MFYPCRYWFTYQCVSWQDLLDLGEPCVKRIFGILQHESRNLKTSEGNICALHSGKLEPSTCSRFSNQRMERLIKSLNDPNLHLWNATVGLVLSVGVVTVRLGWQCLHLSLFLLQICLKSPLLIARYYQIFNQKNQQTAPLCLVEKKTLASRAGSLALGQFVPEQHGQILQVKSGREGLEVLPWNVLPQKWCLLCNHPHLPRKINGWNLRVYTPLEVRKIIWTNAPFSGSSC